MSRNNERSGARTLLLSALDRAGSMVVALYLVWCGLRTVWESRK